MVSAAPINIVDFLDAPETRPTLAGWYQEAWAPWYGPGGDGDAEADLAACRERDALPICLIALGANGEILGTAALKAESVGSELGVGPWLAAMLVDSDHRAQGIGTALAAAIEAKARALGFESLYTSTEATAATMARRGWRPVGPTDSLRGPITVFRRELHTESALN